MVARAVTAGRRAPRRGMTRRGMTLVEVIVAMAILAGVVLGLGNFFVRFGRSVTTSRLQTTASELAATRLEMVRAGPRYLALDSLYGGTEPPLTGPGLAGFTRQTKFMRVGGGPADSVDYQVVTITVRHPALAQPVRRTLAIAAF